LLEGLEGDFFLGEVGVDRGLIGAVEGDDLWSVGDHRAVDLFEGEEEEVLSEAFCGFAVEEGVDERSAPQGAFLVVASVASKLANRSRQVKEWTSLP
jgi:hypothetical protein